MEDKYKQFIASEYRKLWQVFGIENVPEIAWPALPEEPPAPLFPSLEGVRRELGAGCGCTLCPTKTNLVFGEGNPFAKLVFVGDAPGAEEDSQGTPFAGNAGQLLTKIIEAMGYRRQDVYLANVVKCRPPGNRTPAPEEIAQCLPILERQIAAIAPQVVVALGPVATHALLDNPQDWATLRGKFHALRWNGQISVLPTYHPSHLLRNPSAKKIVWEDMKQVMARLENS